MLPAPFRWVGGKSRLRKVIVSMLHPHECYVEVFGGAAWVLFGKEPSKVEVLNDIDGEVVNFFRVIKERPEAFIESFAWDLASREEFERLRKLEPSSLDAIARAHRFYYLIMACWGAELHLARFQTASKDGGHGNRLIGAMKNLRRRILPVYARLQTVIIESLDWRECVNRYNKSHVMMYLDPPYPGNHCNYRHNMRDFELHEELASCLCHLQAKCLLTTYDLPETRRLFDGFHIVPVDFSSGMPAGGERRNREIIVCNYVPFCCERS